ncbi:class I SAM-dependent methyltransferase [Dactylosporangium sp. McL0621]|uniref:class I SAM-dependent methyltransferase n=1 Tax=Dactylosporangium sp. McL0621 TaxID=3415678 RepID=UPI003CECC789
MARRQVAQTAFGAATMRAIEGSTPADMRLFDDRLVGRLLTGAPALIAHRAAVRAAFRAMMERLAPGFFGGVVCRTRAIDDASSEALASGTRQVVILGAGLDTRPYRMEPVRHAEVWELDLPAVQDAKKAAVARTLGALPDNVRYLPVDLAAGTAGNLLYRNGFDRNRRALVVWEAVSQYLCRPAVDAVLQFAGTLAPGSTLAFTYLTPAAFVDARQARRRGWTTGFPPDGLKAELSAYGLSLSADLGADEYQQRYLEPLRRNLTVFPIERLAVATT